MSITIPNLHNSSKSSVKGSADIFISARKDAANTGVFSIKVSAGFDPATDEYPTGSLSIRADLTDSTKGVFTATSFELINSFGKHTPVVYLVGRCKAESVEGAHAAKGCKFWVMIANNKPGTDGNATPDIVSFAIIDRNNNRIAYGTGPVKSGDLNVAALGL